MTTWLLLVVAAGVVTVAGPRLARVVEAISRRTGVGDVLVGAVLLGVATSLPGLVFTVVAAATGDVDLAVANALGGVAAQTFFIAISDIVYRRGTLSSGVPMREVAMQAAVLVVLLSLVVIALGSPDANVGRFHVMTPAIVVTYGVGLAASRRLGRRRADARSRMPPAERAAHDDEDVEAGRAGARGETGGIDENVEGGHGGTSGKMGDVEPTVATSPDLQRSTPALWWRFLILGALLAAAGLGLARAGSDITERTALTAASVGFVLTSVSSSTPELVTAVAAARRGAIGLAAGDIIGGNVFDTLFIAAADLASPDPLFESVGRSALWLSGLAILMNGMLLAGLVRRGRGARRVDLESIGIAAVWISAVVVLVI